jgi:hypothetical protein
VELLSFVDNEGRVQRQELTLLDEHCVWTSGVGLRTGRVEQEGAARTETRVVHPDTQPVPARMLRAALALENYAGEDRYILHIQRVLALARQGLVLSGGASGPSAPAPTAAPTRVPSAPLSPPAPTSSVDPVMLQRQKTEGLTMLIVLGLGLVVGVALLFWLI